MFMKLQTHTHKGYNMKTYEVLIESIGRKTIIIEANSADEAQDAAWDQWDGGTDGYADNSILSTKEVNMSRDEMCTRLINNDLNDWNDKVSQDEYFTTLLCQGFKGYSNMTDKELKAEFDSREINWGLKK